MGGYGINRVGRVLVACCALALAGCGGAPVDRSDGNAPTFVSLNPCIDAILVEVAAPAHVLALSHYSRDPAASSMEVARAHDFGVTGGTAEEVIALRPDVVLASTFMDPATKSALERAGLRVEAFGSPSSVDESLEQIRELAALTGGEEAGEELIAQIESDPAPSPASGKSALLWQPGEIVAGEASLVDEHLRWAGFANYSGVRGLGQADYVSLEMLLADPPDYLLIAGDAPGQEHPLLDRLDGTRVARFDPGLIYCAGPSILRARERLRDIRAGVGVSEL